jgi:hypothetical protein
MIFGSDEKVRLTARELNTLRRANARNGRAVNGIRTRDELLKATLSGLSDDIQADLLSFLESRLNR